MFCINCGKDIPDGSKFCPHCGASQSEGMVGEYAPSDDVILCPKCGSSKIHFVTTQGGQKFDTGDACCGYLLCGPLGLLFGVKKEEPAKTVRKCMNCNHEF